MEAARSTIDHGTIRRWVEAHDGWPAVVKGTRRGESPGILRIGFSGWPEPRGSQTLEPIDWNTFFAWFDANELAFLRRDGEASRFNKLVSRESATPEREHASGMTPRCRVHALHLLERQHREIEGMFADFHLIEDEDEKPRAFAHFTDVIVAHGRIEDTIFYPEVLDDTTEDDLRRALDQHMLLTRILVELYEMEAFDEVFERKFRVLERAVDRHLEQEETELFRLFSDIPSDVFEDMGERMQTLYDALLRQAPLSPVMH